MYRIHGEIELIAPFLYNKPRSEDIKGGDERGAGGRKTAKDKITEAKERVHINGNGLIIPAEMFKKAMLSGCAAANKKLGKKSLYPYLDAGVFVGGDLEFGLREPDGIHEHWGRVPPRTGGLVLLRRPLMNAGRCMKFSLVVFDEMIRPEWVRDSIDAAGFRGLGAWRPKYGRFKVIHWEVEEST